jgi:hypothetical protein
VVERGPEKAGVGGSIPSLATIFQQVTSPPTIDYVPKRSNRAAESVNSCPWIVGSIGPSSARVASQAYANLRNVFCHLVVKTAANFHY